MPYNAGFFSPTSIPREIECKTNLGALFKQKGVDWMKQKRVRDVIEGRKYRLAKLQKEEIGI